MTICFQHARLLRNHQIERGDLWVSHEKIISPREKADSIIDGHDLLIAPGYIDLQINGAFGCDFSHDVSSIDQVIKKLPQYGVTSFLPTVISSTPEKYRKLLPKLQPRKGGLHGASILGIHVEGPCLSPLHPGAHSVDLLHHCDEFSSPEECYGSLQGIKMVTLAPELRGALPWISNLVSRNILVSVGHSAATLPEMQIVMKQGVKMATHLFNAMTPFHHRAPGLVGAILNTSGFFYSIIADGIHLHPVTVDLAWRCQPEGLILISDVMAGLGFDRHTFSLGTKTVDIRNEAAYIQGTSTLAGSLQGIDSGVRQFRKFTGCSMAAALEAASLKPAQVLGISHQKGTLDIGADADFIILNDSLEVQATYVNGHCCYSSKSS